MGILVSKLRNRGSTTSGIAKTHGQEDKTTIEARAIDQRDSTNAKIRPIFLSSSDITSLPSSSFPSTTKGIVTWRTLLSSDITPSNSLTSGIATLPPRTGFLACHRHKQAELYYILEGEGIMKVDSVEQRVEKGSLIFVPGNAEHGIRNLSEKEGGELVWLYCFACDGFGDVVYRFSADEK